MTAIDLPRLAALAKASTPGPWPIGIPIEENGYVIRYIGIPHAHGGYNAGLRSNDAVYIAAADPLTILALIGELEVMEQKAVGIAMRLMEAERVVEAAMRWRKGYGTLLVAADLADALSAHDAAVGERNEGGRT